ncbi:MAG: helix-turn-helix transcriptional regulator [Verrucomicrobiae bacterium]|nr:helix-turn-helix transcriptional regulator [Verrucomicrobiae bacterium]
MKDQDPRTTIARIFRDARLRAGWGVRDLGRRAELSPATISKIEKGEIALGPVTMRKLTAALSLNPSERDQVAEAASEGSARMKTSSKVAAEWADWDQICLAMIRFTRHQTGVEEDEFFQGFGIKSGFRAKGYDLLIRLRDQTWLGFVFKTDEIRVARTEVDDHTALPKPDGTEFDHAGGVTLSLRPIHE